MAIILITPESPPQNTEARLIRFGASIVPERRIICDYAFGRVVSGKFVPDLDRQFRKVFDDTTTPSFVDFVTNVPAMGNLRNQVETYLKSLDNIAGAVD